MLVKAGELEIGREGIQLDCGCYARVLGLDESPDRVVFEIFGNISECVHHHHNGDTKSHKKDEYVFDSLRGLENDRE